MGVPERDDYPRDLRGGYDYSKAIAKAWGDEKDRLQAEVKRLRAATDRGAVDPSAWWTGEPVQAFERELLEHLDEDDAMTVIALVQKYAPPAHHRGAVDRYRAGEDLVSTRVVDYGGPGLPSIIATCPNRGAAQKVARALNAAAGAVDPSEVGRLRGALRRAHEQLSKHDYKGPKQIGRAMMTIEGVMPELARAFDEDQAGCAECGNRGSGSDFAGCPSCGRIEPASREERRDG